MVESKEFPSTRFQGSKRKLVGWIAQSLENLEFSTVLDAFGGTGTISYLLKRMGKQVTYNDILKCNCVTGRAFIANDTTILSDAEINQLCRYSRCNAKRGFVSETFKGFYLTQAENLWLDYILGFLQEPHLGTQDITYKRSIVFHALFQTLLCKRPFNMFHRKNLYLRTAKVQRSFGNKSTWETPTRILFRRFLMEANSYVFQGEQKCYVTNMDVANITDAEYDLVYLDPPYLNRFGNNETADYRSIYHFIEGISHQGAWPPMINYQCKKRSLLPGPPNPWIDPDTNQAAFDSLFDKFSKSILVISYKSNGVPSVRTIVNLLKRHGRNVTTVSKPHQYALRRPGSEPRPNKEVLIISQ
jgi:adenine-specific DNA-methyltransferase